MVKKKSPIKKSSRKRWNIHERVFLVLIIVVLVLGTLNVAKARGWLIPEMDQVIIEGGTIYLDSLSLEQKIAQMVVVHGGQWNLKPWKDMQLGGIHMFALENPTVYKDIIGRFQRGMQIPFFVTADYEGCLNPFANFINATTASEINSVGKAFEKGSVDGELLNSLGFNVNFAPVVDLDDDIWGCRSFPGDEEDVAKFAEAYALGLQSNDVIATAKHYPGKTLVAKDPHKNIVSAFINDVDVRPYEYLLEKDDINSVMVSHIITTGVIDSSGIPSVVSSDVILPIKSSFSGLIISDEINMLGLKNFYSSIDEMYIAVFAAGNDLVLNFNEDPNEVYRMILIVKSAVLDGKIPSEQIDASVTKILELKGFNVE
jgi:beta-N-acetylhexosaminidase